MPCKPGAVKTSLASICPASLTVNTDIVWLNTVGNFINSCPVAILSIVGAWKK